MAENIRSGLPGLMHVDHAALTVLDLEAAIVFYSTVIGGVLLYRIGPFDANDLPPMEDGRDWCEAHINVAGARLTIAMLQMGPNLMLELFQYDRPVSRQIYPPRNCDIGGHHIAFKVQDIDVAISYLEKRKVRVMNGPVSFDEGPCAGLRIIYFLDPWGNQLELVEYQSQAFEASCGVQIYRDPEF